VYPKLFAIEGLNDKLAGLTDEEFDTCLVDTSPKGLLLSVLTTFLPKFVDHNLKKRETSNLGRWIRSGLGYFYETAFDADRFKEPMNLSTFFKIPEDEKPTKQQLREVAFLHALQEFILSQTIRLLRTITDEYKFKVLTHPKWSFTPFALEFENLDALKSCMKHLFAFE